MDDDALHLRRNAMRDHFWSDCIGMGVLCAIYVGMAALGLSLDALSGIATAVWPPTGIALAALTLYGARFWPGIALGALLINIWAGAPVHSASGVAIGNTLEALLGAFLLRRVGFRPALDRLRDVLGLVVLAAGLSPLVSATIGVTSGWWGGLIPATSYVQAWWTWWLGDAMGALIVAPLVFVWSTWPRRRLPRVQLLEAVALVCAVVAVGLIAFGGLWTAPRLEVSYLVFPVLTWGALRFGPLGVVTTLGLVSVLAIAGTAQGMGPFTRDTLHASLLWLQTFIGVVTVTSLVLAAAVAERQRAETQQAQLYQEAQEARATAEESLALLNTLLATAPIGFAFMDLDLRFRRINEALASINGLPPEAHMGRSLHEVLPDLAPIVEPFHRQVLQTGAPLVNIELCGEKPTAPLEQGYWLASYYPVRTRDGRLLGVGVMVIDITERMQVEAYLKTSLQEKEMLLKEIHHRVKNNLQVVCSLLGLQAQMIADPQLRVPFEESQARIQTMALIHQQLYRSGTLGQIDFAEYLRDLATRVVRSSRVGQGHLALEISAEEVYLPIETAIPCGLLLHELLSNCVKHAFPGGQSGTIRATLRRHPQGPCVLTVCDDGVGLPPGLEAHTTTSLGLRLVHLLAAQLQGTLTFESGEGTAVTFTFGDPLS